MDKKLSTGVHFPAMTDTAEMTEEEIRRVAAALKTAVRLSGVSLRRIERTMGLCPGYLSRILAGRVELRVRHVLGVCRVIDLPVDSFFHAVFPRRKETPDDATRVERGLVELHPAPYPVRMHGVVTTPNPVPGALGPWAKADRLLERLRQVLVDIEQNGV
jgi:transcriptional regulator with XRE-family HTH domain